jgi:hypothetical protein
MAAPAAVYRPRNPQSSDYYRCVQDHFETFLQVYEERFERQYGFSDLSRCAWDALTVFLQEVVPEKKPVPGAVIAIQTFGDFLGFNPHCHPCLIREHVAEAHRDRKVSPE